VSRYYRHPETTDVRPSETYHVSCSILALKFLCVSCRNSTLVSAASTGNGVDVTSSVSEARNSDAADLGWKNIWCPEFELEENKRCEGCLKEWGFGYRFDYFKKQRYKNGRKQDLRTASQRLSWRTVVHKSTDMSIEYSHHMVYLMYMLSSRLESWQNTGKKRTSAHRSHPSRG